MREQAEIGRQFIDALREGGFEVQVAFWAKPTEEEAWLLYLASPIVDDKGSKASYQLVHSILRDNPEIWLDPFEIRVIRLDDSLTEAVLARVRPRVPDDQFALEHPNPVRRATWVGRTTLAGVSMDGVYIYPPLRSGASA